MYGFKEEENEDAGLCKRLVKEYEINGRTVVMELGIYRVAFGYRIRGGRYNPEVKDFCDMYEFDICCGPSAEMVSLIYTIVLRAVHDHMESSNRAKELIWLSYVCERKPIFNDINFNEFMNLGFKKDGSVPYVIKVTQEELHEYSVKFMSKMY